MSSSRRRCWSGGRGPRRRAPAGAGGRTTGALREQQGVLRGARAGLSGLNGILSSRWRPQKLPAGKGARLPKGERPPAAALYAAAARGGATPLSRRRTRAEASRAGSSRNRRGSRERGGRRSGVARRGRGRGRERANLLAGSGSGRSRAGGAEKGSQQAPPDMAARSTKSRGARGPRRQRRQRRRRRCLRHPPPPQWRMVRGITGGAPWRPTSGLPVVGAPVSERRMPVAGALRRRLLNGRAAAQKKKTGAKAAEARSGDDNGTSSTSTTIEHYLQQCRVSSKGIAS